jgi:CDP-2,3-bis-(O-geranylgeranyl)-sn-glycerol synthase
MELVWSNFNVCSCCLLQVLECYIISIESFIIPLLSAIWIMLPAYVPNPIAALFGGGTPIDFGRNSPDGRRILGDGKTYRGLFSGILAGISIGLLQIWLSGIFGLINLPYHTPLSVTLLATGALLGDICKSYFKRRRGKERGERWPIADQYDFVAGAFILLLLFDPSWIFTYVTLPVFLIILILTPVLHRVINIFGHVIGVKEVPW